MAETIRNSSRNVENITASAATAITRRVTHVASSHGNLAGCIRFTAAASDTKCNNKVSTYANKDGDYRPLVGGDSEARAIKILMYYI